MPKSKLVRAINTGHIKITEEHLDKAKDARHCLHNAHRATVIPSDLIIDHNGELDAHKTYKNIKNGNRNLAGLCPYNFTVYFTPEACELLDQPDPNVYGGLNKENRRKLAAFIYLQHEHDVDPHSRHA